jgi:hypothetical protein
MIIYVPIVSYSIERHRPTIKCLGVHKNYQSALASIIEFLVDDDIISFDLYDENYEDIKEDLEDEECDDYAGSIYEKIGKVESPKDFTEKLKKLVNNDRDLESVCRMWSRVCDDPEWSFVIEEETV